MLAYFQRKRRHWKKIVPPLWLTPAELMARDLEYYVAGEGKDKVDFALLDGLVKTRDETYAIIKKQLTISTLIFLFLFANYLTIDTGITIAGFSLRYAKGVPEGLMLISSLLSSYTLLLQSNVYLMESAIKFLIKAIVPIELRQLYQIRYFPHEHSGQYTPFNLPHITQSSITTTLKKITALFSLCLLGSVYLAYTYCYVLLVADIWNAARLGNWSKAIAVYMGLMSACGLLFVIVTRMKLRYLDYTTNHEIELMKQIAPEKVNARLQEIYGDLNADQRKMVERGYLSGSK
jgi:hypothetical protein